MNIPSGYSIQLARVVDVAALGAIELEAARLLEEYVSVAIMNETTPVEEFVDAQAAGRLWVSLAGDLPVGFALVEILADGRPHLEEIDVLPAHGRRGLGAAMVRAACDWASAQGHPELTLTTYRDVPWNRPFYAGLGFRVLPPDEWTSAVAAIVERETQRGYDCSPRVVMSRRFPASGNIVERDGSLSGKPG